MGDKLKHYNVLIATPGNLLEAEYVRSLVLTLAECDKRGISYKWLNAYSSLVHHARELTISDSNNLNLNPDDKGPVGDSVTYNKIFWIDSDISWSVEDFFKLYDSDEEVISGVYLLANGKTSTVHTEDHPAGVPKDIIKTMSVITQAKNVGFGFVAVKSGVFEKIQRPWFAHIPQMMYNSNGETLFDSLGEDTSWCIRITEAGVKIYFDPTVLVGHIKKSTITW